jgi:peptide/nickel transport system ATP-binding protein
MYAGQIVEQGNLRDIVRNPIHPYARGLLASTIHGAKRGERLDTIPGTPPSLQQPPQHCSFAPRCRFAESRCTEALPPNIEIGGGRFARCILPRPARTVVAP